MNELLKKLEASPLAKMLAEGCEDSLNDKLVTILDSLEPLDENDLKEQINVIRTRN